jgi:protocatechuate 3,4-dioxygenase beta subunit
MTFSSAPQTLSGSALSASAMSSSASSAIAQVAAPCAANIIPTQTEGPYYKSGSPERGNIREEDTAGIPLMLTGRVLDENCQPIANAWLDFWQADGDGDYDNKGFELRGHQFTNEKGEYRLESVVPEEYPGRTPHIHVKIRIGDSYMVHTSQLYLPNIAHNQTDPIFNAGTVIKITSTENGMHATFDIIVPRT